MIKKLQANSINFYLNWPGVFKDLGTPSWVAIATTCDQICRCAEIDKL